MAATIATAITGDVTAGSTATTILQLTAPLDQGVKILGWGVFFEGTSVSAEPATIRLTRQTTSGTLTSLSPVRLDNRASGSMRTTAAGSSSSEPTTGSVLEVLRVHPQSGYEKLYPLGQEVIIANGSRIGIEVTVAASVNCAAKFIFEE